MTMPDAGDFAALQRLASLYWGMADAAVELALADLFTANAKLELGSLLLDGLPAIETFFVERARTNAASGRVTRHVASNFLVDAEASDRVIVRSTVLVYAGSGGLPLPATLPSGIADFEDICVRDGRAWKFDRKRGVTVFTGEGAPAFARGRQ